MTSNQEGSDPFKNITEEKISELIKANDALDQEESRVRSEEIEEAEKRRSDKKLFRRLRKSPLEIINRFLFLLFIGGFLFSFFSVYATSRWWFFWYLVSAFSCIAYTPNRKAIKELLDAWPNIIDLIKGTRK
ncbi:DUP family protein [Prochlorococcus sp. MIT 1341]|uniref:DUP family protein n=1 Tax=Prochlorococcus sp. MIT 1341 TaxID=3096221 RepID=UPI002A765E2B|nr:DUP family protein [Prochlorococcus sp. MIT 1341]